MLAGFAGAVPTHMVVAAVSLGLTTVTYYQGAHPMDRRDPRHAGRRAGSQAVLVLFLGVEAATGQVMPQAYDVAGAAEGQFVMLQGWAPFGHIEYSGFGEATPRYFTAGQRIWLWCSGATTSTTVADVANEPDGGARLTLASPPDCSGPMMVSNHEFPEQSWSAGPPTQSERERIFATLETREGLEITRIDTRSHGSIFLVFDPRIEAIYGQGGHRLLGADLEEISVLPETPVTPLIDLDADGVPEFLVPSSDGPEAWLVRLYPEVDQEMSHWYRYVRSLR